MRKRTFEDRKFSQGDANSQAYRDNWDRTFGAQCGLCKNAKPCDCEKKLDDLTALSESLSE